METIHRYAVALALTAVAAIASLLAAPDLPAEVAIHWNAAGEADDFAPRWVALTVIPALAVGILGLFAVLPRIDPLGENIEAFRTAYDYLAVLTVALLVYVHGIVLALNIGYSIDILQAVAPAVAVVYVAAGFVLERAEQNWFIGIRTPWTLSDERVWQDTHKRAAPLFKAAGVLTLGAVVLPEYAIVFIVGPAAAVAAYTTGYSYFSYRRHNRRPNDNA